MTQPFADPFRDSRDRSFLNTPKGTMDPQLFHHRIQTTNSIPVGSDRPPLDGLQQEEFIVNVDGTSQVQMDDSFMASEQHDYLNGGGIVVAASENGEVISASGGASFPNVSHLNQQNEYD